MCVGRITNPDCFDAFDFDKDASDPIEDEHHAIVDALIMPPPGKIFKRLFPSHVFNSI